MGLRAIGSSGAPSMAFLPTPRVKAGIQRTSGDACRIGLPPGFPDESCRPPIPVGGSKINRCQESKLLISIALVKNFGLSGPAPV